MKQVNTTFRMETNGPGLTDITVDVTSWVQDQGMEEGLLTLFVQHTSASLMIQENADPDVQRDLQTFFEKLSPWDESLYRHSTEGEDDMPAHIRSALTQTSLSIPLIDARLVLGTWQGIYFFEHRAHRQRRNMVMHLYGN